MKKVFAVLFALLCMAVLFTGCSNKSPAVPLAPSNSPVASPSPSAAVTAQPPATASPTAPAPSSGGVRTGLGVTTTVQNSTSATADAEGVGEIDSTIVAVTLDGSDKILSCVIDAVQPDIDFDNAGKLTTPADTLFQTKDELGAAYGMQSASGINQEWNQEAASFAQYITGKTLDEVKGIAVNASGAPTGSDLTASVTISITPFIDTLDKAVANAAVLGAAATDTLHLGVVTNMGQSVSATADATGVAQAASSYVVVTTDDSGKITSCIVDASQGTVNFDSTGAITSDLTAEQPTKDELGSQYGMQSASGIGKEWNQQAAAFAQYITGKTVEQISDITVNASGAPTNSDLTASVTIDVGDFITALEDALSQ